TDAMRPQQAGEWNVPHRTDERDHGNDWTDQRILDQPNNRWSGLEKQSFPPIMRHQRRQKSGNQKAAENFFPKHRPIHDKALAGARPFPFLGFANGRTRRSELMLMLDQRAGPGRSRVLAVAMSVFV